MNTLKELAEKLRKAPLESKSKAANNSVQIERAAATKYYLEQFGHTHYIYVDDKKIGYVVECEKLHNEEPQLYTAFTIDGVFVDVGTLDLEGTVEELISKII